MTNQKNKATQQQQRPLYFDAAVDLSDSCGEVYAEEFGETDIYQICLYSIV